MASKFGRDPCNENIVNIDNVLRLGPVRPVVDFPRSKFGASDYRFQESWYSKYDWIEYSCEKDAAFCFHCRLFGTSGELFWGISSFSFNYSLSESYLSYVILELLVT